MFTVSTVILPQTQDTINPEDLGVNYKNGGTGCSERCKNEVGPVAGETGPVWGGEILF